MRARRSLSSYLRPDVLGYEADTDGAPCNVDRVTFRLLRPAPWGSDGWKAWGLRHWEAGTLRQIMLNRQEGHRRVS